MRAKSPPGHASYVAWCFTRANRDSDGLLFQSKRSERRFQECTYRLFLRKVWLMEQKQFPYTQILVLFVAVGLGLIVLMGQHHVRIPGGIIIFGRTFVANADLFTIHPDGTDLQQLTFDPMWESLPAWSPDGQKIAFAVATWDGSTNTGNDVYVMDALGSNAHSLTHSLAYEPSPTWSPDNKQIAFISSVGEGSQLFIINLETLAVRQITNTCGYKFSPAWSPDGNFIIFGSFCQDGERGIYITNIDGSDSRLLAPTVQYNDSPVWSPDGQRIAFYDENDGFIYIMNADGTNRQPLIKTGRHMSWSPDGCCLVVTFVDQPYEDLYIVDITGKTATKLVRNAGHPNWHP